MSIPGTLASPVLIVAKVKGAPPACGVAVTVITPLEKSGSVTGKKEETLRMNFWPTVAWMSGPVRSMLP
jgi:hypothetical protein